MNLRKDHYWILNTFKTQLVRIDFKRVQMVLTVACLSAVTAASIKPRNGGYLA